MAPRNRQIKPFTVLTVAALLTAATLCGCLTSERTATPVPVAQQAPTPQHEKNRSLSAPVGAPIRKTEASAPGPKETAGEPLRSKRTAPVIEKIPGYKTPAEYFSIASPNYPEGTVAVTLPLDYEKHPEKKYPLVIAFGGAGECVRPPKESALAWMYYYKADEAMVELRHNHLTLQDFRDLAKPSLVMAYNRRLKRQPYEGVILACPSTPPALPGPELPRIEEYVMNELIPALKSRYRVAANAIGVDGVSMGGSRAMYYGLKYPEVFTSIGSIQGAVGPYMDLYRYFIKTNRRLLKTRSIQLVTSDHDVMRPAVEEMHKLLQKNGIPHSFLVLSGPHDYIFNQGPGVIALLVFHDEALRGGN
jgi:iron(III)-salmochelin esterase